MPKPAITPPRQATAADPTRADPHQDDDAIDLATESVAGEEDPGAAMDEMRPDPTVPRKRE